MGVLRYRVRGEEYIGPNSLRLRLQYVVNTLYYHLLRQVFAAYNMSTERNMRPIPKSSVAQTFGMLYKQSVLGIAWLLRSNLTSGLAPRVSAAEREAERARASDRQRELKLQQARKSERQTVPSQRDVSFDY